MKPPLARDLAEHVLQFREHRMRAARLCGGLTTPQFNWRPQPDRWSMAECLVHLNLSARIFGQAIGSAIGRGRAAGLLADGPFRYGPLSRVLLWAVDPDNKRRFKAPARFVPETAPFEVADVLEEFVKAGVEWERLLREAEGLDLRRVKLASPAAPLLRFPLGAVFAVQCAHERRHLQQAEQVRAEPGFPA
jgi:hypothetical protein